MKLPGPGDVEAIKAVTCPRCGAEPAQNCFTPNGRRMNAAHTERVQAHQRRQEAERKQAGQAGG